MILTIEDQTCWICGSNNFLTTHHALPQHLKPIHNLLIPICKACHSKLNEEDFQSLYSFLTKINLSLRENATALNKTTKEFEEVEKKIKLGGFLENK